MDLFLKPKSPFFWYDFTVRGERYRGSTKETDQTRAAKVAALKLAAAIKGSDPLDRKPPTLREYWKDFLEWVDTGRLEADTRRYFRNGSRLLLKTKIAGKRLDQLTRDEIEKLRFPGGPSNGNNALRTLRRMLNKAKEDKLIREVPDFALFKETGRSLRLNEEGKRRLLPVAEQLLKDIIVVMRDTGLRNAREIYRMCVENIDNMSPHESDSKQVTLGPLKAHMGGPIVAQRPTRAMGRRILSAAQAPKPQPNLLRG